MKEFKILSSDEVVTGLIDYRPSSVSNVAMVVCMNGGVPFSVDVQREWGIEHVEYVRASSYKDGKNTGDVLLESVNFGVLAGKNIIFCDDIIDSRATFKAVRAKLFAAGVASVVPVTLVNKNPRPGDLYIYDGRGDTDTFYFGYGMDRPDGTGRHLPDLWGMKKETAT